MNMKYESVGVSLVIYFFCISIKQTMMVKQTERCVLTDITHTNQSAAAFPSSSHTHTHRHANGGAALDSIKLHILRKLTFTFLLP